MISRWSSPWLQSFRAMGDIDHQFAWSLRRPQRRADGCVRLRHDASGVACASSHEPGGETTLVTDLRLVEPRPGASTAGPAHRPDGTVVDGNRVMPDGCRRATAIARTFESGGVGGRQLSGRTTTRNVLSAKSRGQRGSTEIRGRLGVSPPNGPGRVAEDGQPNPDGRPGNCSLWVTDAERRSHFYRREGSVGGSRRSDDDHGTARWWNTAFLRRRSGPPSLPRRRKYHLNRLRVWAPVLSSAVATTWGGPGPPIVQVWLLKEGS